jgi:hypothetical protein
MTVLKTDEKGQYMNSIEKNIINKKSQTKTFN